MASPIDPEDMAVDSAVPMVKGSQSPEIRPAALDNIPVNVFGMIMSHLEPIWIYNVSHVCSFTRDALSHSSGGNRIWYDAMPSAMWSETRCYQHASSPANGATLPSTADSMPTTPTATTSNNGQRSPTSQDEDVAATTASSAVNQVTNPPAVHFQGHSSPDSSPNPTRLVSSPGLARSGALGGTYNPYCDYRSELVGRFQEAARCNVCLCYHNYVLNVRLEKHLGVLWCNACLGRYTISGFDVHRLIGHEGDMISWVGALSVNGAREVFLVTEIEKRLRETGHPGLRLIDIQMTRIRHHIKLDTLQCSMIEPYRRELRHIIVEAAQAIWDGGDVAKVLSGHGYNVRVREGSETYHQNPDAFTFFRQRWAPTSKLGGFLFPKHLLHNSPTVNFHEGGTWLPDPSVDLYPDMNAVQTGVQASRIVKATRMMLDRLVAHDYARHADHKIGRHVSKWAQAAMAHHDARVRKEVISGGMVHALDVPRGRGYAGRFRSLHQLRKKCDMEKFCTEVSAFLPDRPLLCDSFTMSQADFISADRAALAKRAKWTTAVKNFNIIILATWKFCSKTGGVYHPAGIEGFLMHFEQNHTEMFYNSDHFGLNY